MSAAGRPAAEPIALDLPRRLSLVAEAAHAPSVHNIQPARWRFDPTGCVLLYRALDRELPAADPTGRDVRVSLGAAWEGMAIAMSRHGLGLETPSAGAQPPANALAVPGHALVARGTVVRRDDGADRLAPWVHARRSHRGVFRPTPPHVLRRLYEMRADDVRLTSPGAPLASHARLHDRVSYGFIAEPAYQHELHRWLRLERAHSAWARDGINADCLALSAAERWVASLAFRPAVFQRLQRLGMARMLVSEAAQIRSAAALLLFVPERTLDDFPIGRRFYRLWLELTALGLSLAPMSALADSPESAALLCEMHEIPATRRLANVFRVGMPPAEGAARSPRLPAGELLLE